MGLPLGYPIPTTVVPAVAPSATPAPTPIPTALSSADATDTNPAAIRAFLLRLLDSTRRALSGARPWSELADRSVLSRLDSLAEATSQLRKNLAYFRVNYDAVVALSLAAALLAHPFWPRAGRLVPPLRALPSRRGPRRRVRPDLLVLGGLVAASAFVVFLTSEGSLIFFVLALGAAVMCAHGACRVPADLFLDEVVDQGAGAGNPLLSFVASATGGGRV
ncbi:unnamed protein product [Miscanthus lutarioriparius]|uniref:PRA1 family protein n=1 Tax=Miscanthus lutarioriparius TaxID=422564 RepID=A0A811RYS1_9POAL|nr:unnamed protein product [Miscanthus lutarioriparius]